MGVNYENRLRRVIKHIYDNPAGDLSLDALADVAALSRFHWHRIFHAMTGETCADAVRRIRLHHAALWLTQEGASVEDVAARAGYDNAQSFVRAFKSAFGQTPAAFRKSGRPQTVALCLKEIKGPMFNVTMKDIAAIDLVGLPHKGAYHEIGRAYADVNAAMSARNLWGYSRGMVAVYFDDPTAVPMDELTSFAGMRVADGFEMPDRFERYRIPNGRHAVLRFKGPYSGLQGAYDYLYGQWFAASGEAPGDTPSFEIYLNSPIQTAPSDLLTEICAPLQSSTGHMLSDR